MFNIEDIELRLDQEEERTVSGIAVPFNETITLADGSKERFEPGAVQEFAETKLFYGHNQPIGKVTHLEDRDEGIFIKARISETPTGDEIRTLLQDGVLNKFSVGFTNVESRQEEGVTVRTKVNLREVSVVPFPAYSGAEVTAVREENNQEGDTQQMETNEIANDVKALSEEVADLKRSVEIIPTSTGPVEKKFFRSVGEYAKGLSRQDDNALELFAMADELRDVTSAASIVLDAWIGDLSRIIDRGRPTVQAFSQQALPASGLNVEWGQVASNTIDSQDQGAELADLVYGELTLETQTSPVKTYGGWAGCSFQTVQRSSVNYLDTLFRAMAVGYSRRINKELVDLLEAADYTNATVTKASDDAEGWIRAIAESAQIIDENQAFNLDFLLVAPDAFVDLVAIVDGNGRADLAAYNPSNNIGSANVPGMKATVLGLPVIIEHELADGSIYACSEEAWITMESSGAPVRLQDENIVNLSKQFSLYGYAAFANPYPGAVVQVV